MTTDDLDREAAYGQLPTFSRLIQHFRRGTKDDELTGQLAEVVGMVKAAQAHGIKKAGTLAIKITVDPLTDDQVGVSIESQVRGPKLPRESAGRRLTRRNNDLIARGIHPATRQPIVAALGTCGTCARAHRYDHHNRTYWKCDLHRLGQSHSAASDIRSSWVACSLHTTREEQ